MTEPISSERSYKDCLEARLGVLESALAREQRRSRSRSLLAVLALSSLGLAAATQDPVPLRMQAKSFEVVDDSGAVVARSFASDGGGAFEVFDRDGQRRMSLRALGPEAGLRLFGDKEQLLYSVADAGGASLGTHYSIEGDGSVAVTVGSSPEGGLLRLADRTGELRGIWSARPKGSQFTLLTESGRPAFTARTQAEDAQIHFNDSEGETVFEAGHVKGRSSLAIHGTAGSQAAMALEVNGNTSGISLFGNGPKALAGITASAVGADLQLNYRDGSNGFGAAVIGRDVAFAVADSQGQHLYGAGSTGLGLLQEMTSAAIAKMNTPRKKPAPGGTPKPAVAKANSGKAKSAAAAKNAAARNAGGKGTPKGNAKKPKPKPKPKPKGKPKGKGKKAPAKKKGRKPGGTE